MYAANMRGVVQDNLDDFVPNLSGAKLPGEDGKSFYYLAIVRSPYLTDKVNPARTDFELAQDDAEIGNVRFTEEVSRPEIRDACIRRVEADLEGIIRSINEAKTEKIRSYVEADAPQYKILLKYLPDFIDDISANPKRTGHGANNMAVVRHFALNLVRQVADKRSIKRRRKRAAWDPQYLLEILGPPQPRPR
jgi:hypothetical protein